MEMTSEILGLLLLIFSRCKGLRKKQAAPRSCISSVLAWGHPTPYNVSEKGASRTLQPKVTVEKETLLCYLPCRDTCGLSCGPRPSALTSTQLRSSPRCEGWTPCPSQARWTAWSPARHSSQAPCSQVCPSLWIWLYSLLSSYFCTVIDHWLASWGSLGWPAPFGGTYKWVVAVTGMGDCCTPLLQNNLRRLMCFHWWEYRASIYVSDVKWYWNNKAFT